MLSRFAPLIRAAAFVRKEVVEVLRQPRLLLTLVAGPFLILLLFGLGYQANRPLRTLLVYPDGDQLGEAVESWATDVGPAIDYLGSTPDGETARRRLEEGDVDVVAIIPLEAEQTLRNNQQATFVLLHDELDPFEQAALDFFARGSIEKANDELLRRAVEAGTEVVTAGNELPEIDPDVLVNPFIMDIEQVRGISLSLTDYYAPAVIVLLLQHTAVTFAALSVVRERYLGTADVFQVAPLTAGEMLSGKYLGHFLLGGALGALLVAGAIYGYGVPMNGDVWWLAASLGGVILASLGLGLLLSSLVETDTQAVQASMIVLLFSIFFSGFVLSAERLTPAIRPLSWIIPATHGIVALQDVMFRGVSPDGFTQAWLAGLTVGLALIAYVGIRRRMRPAT